MIRELYLLFQGEMKRSFILLRRYFFSTLVGILFFYGIFMAIYLGARLTGGNIKGTIVGEWIVGYLAWFYILSVLSMASEHIKEEATLGTLEQVYLNSRGLIRVLTVRTIADLCRNTLTDIIPLSFLLILSTSYVFSAKAILTALPIFILFLIGAYGLALILSGAVLVFKRIGTLVTLFQILFLGAAFAPLSKLPIRVGSIISALPVMGSFDILKKAMTSGTVEYNTFTILNPLMYLTIGIICFNLLEKVAKNHGLLSHY